MSTGTGPSPTHVYKGPGEYTATVLAADGAGGVATATTRVIVGNAARSSNVPPLAAHNGPLSGTIDEEIIFDASGSTDPDSDALTYAWTFGDGASDSGPTVGHVYKQAGTYTVRTLVSDGHGGATTAMTTAVIARRDARSGNRPPIARAAGPANAWAGTAVTFNGRESSDPDGDVLTLTWTFDDGASAIGPEATHVFTAAGNHWVRLLAGDGQGGVATSVLTIKIVNAQGNQLPVAAIGGPYSGVVGGAITFDAGRSRDPDGDDLTFAWDFGDDTNAYDRTPTHAYVQAGTFVASLLVADDNGGVAAVSTNVVVTAPPRPAGTSPVASAGGPYEGRVGLAVTLDGRDSSDPGEDHLQFAWTFGDGSVGVGRTLAHTYAKPGTYQVMLLVTDGKGGTATAVTTSRIDSPSAQASTPQ